MWGFLHHDIEPGRILSVRQEQRSIVQTDWPTGRDHDVLADFQNCRLTRIPLDIVRLADMAPVGEHANGRAHREWREPGRIDLPPNGRLDLRTDPRRHRHLNRRFINDRV